MGSTNREVTLRWPLFIQIGPTAKKIGEVTSTIQPRGVIWKDLQAHIQNNLSNHLQSNYNTFLERKRQRILINYNLPSKYVYMLTIEIIKLIFFVVFFLGRCYSCFGGGC